MSRELVARVGARLQRRHVVLFLSGLLAGASIEWAASDAVALPLLGATPGVAVGGLGLAVAAVGYYQYSCMGNGDCGCTGECNGSCRVDH